MYNLDLSVLSSQSEYIDLVLRCVWNVKLMTDVSLSIPVYVFLPGVLGQSVPRASRGSLRRKWCERRRTLCTTCTASPASCAVGSLPPGMSFTSWKTAGSSARRTTRPLNKMVGFSHGPPLLCLCFSCCRAEVRRRCCVRIRLAPLRSFTRTFRSPPSTFCF